MRPDLTTDKLTMVLLANGICFAHAQAMNVGHWTVIAKAANTRMPTSAQREECLNRIRKHETEAVHPTEPHYLALVYGDGREEFQGPLADQEHRRLFYEVGIQPGSKF